jgi:hypothetical protein
MTPSYTGILRSTLIAGALAIGTLASNRFALAASDRDLGTLNIPFSFRIEKQELPSGTYQLKLTPDKVLLLQGSNGETHRIAVHLSSSQKSPQTGYVIFRRYGEIYFLGQVWQGGNNTALECYLTPVEKQIAIALTQSTAGLTQIALSSPKQ